MEKLSAVIIAYNEEKFIEDALRSLSFVNEIIVVDNGSTDKTVEIAQKYGAKVIYHEWMGYGRQRQISIEHATHDWILMLDCDERITPSLRQEIEKELEHPEHKVYKIPHLNKFFGKFIRYAGQHPDYHIRLFNKDFAHFNSNKVHEGIETKERIGKLKESIEHLAYDTIEEFIAKQNKYSSLNAKSNFFKAIVNPYWTFFKLYFLRLGFLEGKRGFIIAKVYASYTFWKYIK